jgi:hypothetical protein
MASDKIVRWGHMTAWLMVEGGIWMAGIQRILKARKRTGHGR